MSCFIMYEPCTELGLGLTVNFMFADLIVKLHLLLSTGARRITGREVLMSRFAGVIVRMLTGARACADFTLCFEHDFIFDVAKCATALNLIKQINEWIKFFSLCIPLLNIIK